MPVPCVANGQASLSLPLSRNRHHAARLAAIAPVCNLVVERLYTTTTTHSEWQWQGQWQTGFAVRQADSVPPIKPFHSAYLSTPGHFKCSAKQNAIECRCMLKWPPLCLHIKRQHKHRRLPRTIPQFSFHMCCCQGGSSIQVDAQNPRSRGCSSHHGWAVMVADTISELAVL